jgi:copper(I)-binding protein
MRAIMWAGLAAVLSSGAARGQEPEHEFSHGTIEIVHPWTRAASTGGETLVFMEIINSGATDRLLGAESPVGEAVHIVGLTLSPEGTSVTEIGPVDIPVGDFDLDPGGLGLELHGLTATLEPGGHFPLTLNFANAGTMTIEVLIEAADASQHSHAGHSH